MLRLFVTVLPGLLPLALLTMGLSATLSVGAVSYTHLTLPTTPYV